ncbi:uncharacterized protein METZ01_LOCUS489732, partial [marine metagenome]
GDTYNFDIKQDNVNGTLVFEVHGGNSSCPWEYGTNARDGLEINIDPPNQPNLLPDSSGIYTISVNNISNSQEARSYFFSLDELSNPGGLTINNLPSDPFIVEMDAQFTRDITVDRGPIDEVYEDIRILAYPACEYEDYLSGAGSSDSYNYSMSESAEDLSEQGLDPALHGVISIFDDAQLDISWAPTCTDVEFLVLSNGWFINQNDSLFSIPINVLQSDQETLDEVECNYRTLGGSDV